MRMNWESRFRDPETERINMIEEANRLLAKIVEKGGSMNPAQLASLRSQLQALLKDIPGVINMEDLVTQLPALNVWLHERRSHVQEIPEGFPSKEAFVNAYQAVRGEPLFHELRARGESVDVADYLYGIALLMTDRIVYESIFGDDAIEYNNDGAIENGRHRAAAMRVLQESSYRIPTWVK